MVVANDIINKLNIDIYTIYNYFKYFDLIYDFQKVQKFRDIIAKN